LTKTVPHSQLYRYIPLQYYVYIKNINEFLIQFATITGQSLFASIFGYRKIQLDTTKPVLM